MVETASILCLVVLLCITARKRSGNTLSPCAALLGYWIVMLSVSLPFSGFAHYQTGYLLSALFCIFYWIGFTLAANIQFSTPKIDYNFEFIDKQLGRTGICALPIGLLALTGTLAVTGVSLSSFEDVNTISAEMTKRRYGQESNPFYITLALAFVYYGALISGWILAGRKRPFGIKNVLLYWPIFLSLGYAILTTARATFFFSTILFLSSFIASGVFRNSTDMASTGGKLFSKNVIKLCMTTVIFVGASFFLIGLLRIQKDNALELLANKIEAYFSSVQGLHIWFGQWDGYEITAGRYTFAGMAEIIGLSVRELGMVQDYYFTEIGNMSNLYTLFRWLIEDFSLIGSFLIVFVLGIVNRVYWNKMDRGNVFAVLLYTFTMVVFLWSSITSVLAYNSIILAMGLFSLAIIYYSRKARIVGVTQLPRKDYGIRNAETQLVVDADMELTVLSPNGIVDIELTVFTPSGSVDIEL